MVPDPARWMRRFNLTKREGSLPSQEEDYNEKKMYSNTSPITITFSRF